MGYRQSNSSQLPYSQYSAKGKPSWKTYESESKYFHYECRRFADVDNWRILQILLPAIQEETDIEAKLVYELAFESIAHKTKESLIDSLYNIGKPGVCDYTTLLQYLRVLRKYYYTSEYRDMSDRYTEKAFAKLDYQVKCCGAFREPNVIECENKVTIILTNPDVLFGVLLGASQLLLRIRVSEVLMGAAQKIKARWVSDPDSVTTGEISLAIYAVAFAVPGIRHVPSATARWMSGGGDSTTESEKLLMERLKEGPARVRLPIPNCESTLMRTALGGIVDSESIAELHAALDDGLGGTPSPTELEATDEYFSVDVDGGPLGKKDALRAVFECVYSLLIGFAAHITYDLVFVGDDDEVYATPEAIQSVIASAIATLTDIEERGCYLAALRRAEWSCLTTELTVDTLNTLGELLEPFATARAPSPFAVPGARQRVCELYLNLLPTVARAAARDATAKCPTETSAIYRSEYLIKTRSHSTPITAALPLQTMMGVLLEGSPERDAAWECCTSDHKRAVLAAVASLAHLRLPNCTYNELTNEDLLSEVKVLDLNLLAVTFLCSVIKSDKSSASFLILDFQIAFNNCFTCFEPRATPGHADALRSRAEALFMTSLETVHWVMMRGKRQVLATTIEMVEERIFGFGQADPCPEGIVNYMLLFLVVASSNSYTRPRRDLPKHVARKAQGGVWARARGIVRRACGLGYSLYMSALDTTSLHRPLSNCEIIARCSVMSGVVGEVVRPLREGFRRAEGFEPQGMQPIGDV